MEDLLFYTNGIAGHLCQRLYSTYLEIVTQHWDEIQSRSSSKLSIEKILSWSASTQRAMFWTVMAGLWVGNFEEPRRSAELLKIWAEFERVFGRTFKRDTKEVSEEHTYHFFELTRVLTGVWNRDIKILGLRIALLNYSHGPFSEAQLQYLVSKHPRLLEAGAGSGYLLAEYCRRGGDGIGFDDFSYWAGEERPPHTESLKASGHLLVGGSDLVAGLCEGRTLGIFFPEPYSIYPYESLRAYTEAGGKNFLLKLGGMLGSPAQLRTGGPAWKLEPDNAGRFFEYLAEYWVADPDGPDYDVRLWTNNLWAFKRR